MYNQKFNHCRFWFMSAELKNLLLASQSLNGNYGVKRSFCNLYNETYGIEVVQEAVDQNGNDILTRICQHFTPLSYWYYKRFYAVPAQIHWDNIITRWLLPNFICKIRGWKNAVKNGRCVRGVPDCTDCKKHCKDVKAA